MIRDFWEFLFDWFEFRFIHRLHVVKTSLPPGLYEADERMFHACFAVLGDFVEVELGIARVDHDGPIYRGYRLHTYNGDDQRAIDLWRWYDQDLRAMLKAAYADPFGRISPTDWMQIDTDKQEKFNELVAIREYLWT